MYLHCTCSQVQEVQVKIAFDKVVGKEDDVYETLFMAEEGTMS